MRRRHQKVVVPLWAAVFLTASLVAGLPPRSVKAAADSRIVTEGIAIGGSVSNSTISNTVNQENPATLAMLAKALADKDTSEEYRRQAEVKAAELATKFGFTSTAVGQFFRILGERKVPEDKVPARLIEIATHFAQTRDELAALEPDDPHVRAQRSSAS
jgi:hypothetical protein